jgi:DNA ligase (NAD+)
MIDDLGVHWPTPEQNTGDESSVFYGLTVVITGSFSGMTRAELKTLLEKAGARVAGSVSRKTDLVVAGVSPGSKVEKAKVLGVDIMDEAMLMQHL